MLKNSIFFRRYGTVRYIDIENDKSIFSIYIESSLFGSITVECRTYDRVVVGSTLDQVAIKWLPL